MALGDMQDGPLEMQDGSPPMQTAPTAGAYSPPAVVGEILVTVDWQEAGTPPSLLSFALPMVARLHVSASTEAGGTLDPAGIPLQVALSTTMHPAVDGLTWMDVVYDGATRLAEIEVPQGTAAGNYYVVWRSLLTNNAPTAAAGRLDNILVIG